VVICRIVLLGVLILLVSAVGAQDKPPATKAPAQRADAASGKQTYKHYCASAMVLTPGGMDRRRSC
jgi:hypothetical protein